MVAEYVGSLVRQFGPFHDEAMRACTGAQTERLLNQPRDSVIERLLNQPKEEVVSMMRNAVQEGAGAEHLSKWARLDSLHFSSFGFHIEPQEQHAEEAFLNELNSSVLSNTSVRELLVDLFGDWHFVKNGLKGKAASGTNMGHDGKEYYFWYVIRILPVYVAERNATIMSIAFVMGVGRWSFAPVTDFVEQFAGFSANDSTVIAQGLRAKIGEYGLKALKMEATSS